jgi:hypothetical protein
VAGFSAGQAIGSGFRLIGREPKTMLIWIVAYAVWVGAIYALMFGAMPELLGYYQEMARAGTEGGEPDPSQAMAMVSKMFAVMPILLILALVGYSIMLGAVYRATLHPEDRKFGYLRFGRGELWLMLTLLVWSILIGFIYIVASIAVTVVGGVIGVALAGGAQGDPAAVAAPILIGMGLCWLFMIWIMLRLSLALPMSHDQQRFVIFDSWKVTRGQSLKMFGVGVALVVLVFVIELVLVSVIAGVALAGAGGLEAFVTAQTDVLARSLMVWFPVFVLVAAVFSVLLFTIMATPIADIYRQLTAPDETRATV